MIVAFYSYKGGTGRTMALANIACLLAKAGRRVLAVDFDLEAPGLWRYFEEFRRGLDQRVGLIDLLEVLMSDERPDMEDRPNLIDWRAYTTRVRIGAESVTLMTSGKQDENYPARVLGLDWAEFFRNRDGGEFFEQLRDEWSREFDFVLIDSRTGITDIGGICTIALPDMIVPVFTANWQNIDGVVDTLRRAQRGRQELAYDRPPALVLPVLSRFDSRTELESANEWLSRAASMLGEFYADWLPQEVDPRVALERTKLPYVAYFGFGERLAIQLQGTTDPESLGYALNSVARLIDTHLKDVPSVILGKDDLRLIPDAASRLEPPTVSWIAAIYEHEQLIGTGVAIDQKRVVVSSHLIEGKSAERFRVSFPLSDERRVRGESHHVERVHGRTDGVSVLHLQHNMPPSVGAAPLRFPRARDLIGRPWWGFGFPRGHSLGIAASGTVAATLAFGAIRLDTGTPSFWVPGISGTPVWSPDHGAVVAIVATFHVDEYGAALPLAEVVDDLPDEGLMRLAADWPEPALDSRSRSAFISELASVFNEDHEATRVLSSIGIARRDIPDFGEFRRPILYWDQVVTDLENGRVPDGLAKLVSEAVNEFPGNRVFQETDTQLRAAAPQE